MQLIEFKNSQSVLKPYFISASPFHRYSFLVCCISKNQTVVSPTEKPKQTIDDFDFSLQISAMPCCTAFQSWWWGWATQGQLFPPALVHYERTAEGLQFGSAAGTLHSQPSFFPSEPTTWKLLWFGFPEAMPWTEWKALMMIPIIIVNQPFSWCKRKVSQTHVAITWLQERDGGEWGRLQ